LARPRILLVPAQTELEWRIRPLLEEWAEVASFDAPGVGDEPAVGPPGAEGAIERGVAELDERGWETCVVVGDEFGTFTAVFVAAKRPERVRGLALGHACLSLRDSGERAPVSGEVSGALRQLRDVDYRTYARHLTQITQGAYDEELVDEFIERVPRPVIAAYDESLARRSEEALEPLIRSLDVPLLLAKHEGCLAWTDEGWEDMVAAFPEAATIETELKPSCSPEFAEALRSFCLGLD
jgi:pimeloyl-ACP methyl ester carboxylesterase